MKGLNLRDKSAKLLMSSLLTGKGLKAYNHVLERESSTAMTMIWAQNFNNIQTFKKRRR